MRIILYATNKGGGGFVQRIGDYDTLEDITIRCGMFAPDVVITFEQEDEKDMD